MGTSISGKVGPNNLADGITGDGATFRMGKQGDQMASPLHPFYYETNYRNNLYCFGIKDTVLAAVNSIAQATDATSKPIIGIWNPSTSGVNVVLIQAMIQTSTIAATAVSPAGFAWEYSTGNNAITTGSTPVSCSTLIAGGSKVKAFAISTALTGLTNALAVMRGSPIQTINAAGPGTAIHQALGTSLELLDGSIIIPPGGYCGLRCAASTTTVNCTSGMLWEEVPV